MRSFIAAAQQSITEADLAGAAWLAERGYDGCFEEPQKSLCSDKEPDLRAAAEKLYLAAFVFERWGQVLFPVWTCRHCRSVYL